MSILASWFDPSVESCRGSWVYEIESTTVNATGTTVKFGQGGQQEARGTGSPTAGGGTFYLSHRKVVLSLSPPSLLPLSFSLVPTYIRAILHNSTSGSGIATLSGILRYRVGVVPRQRQGRAEPRSPCGGGATNSPDCTRGEAALLA
jgi:hypothetical protein